MWRPAHPDNFRIRRPWCKVQAFVIHATAGTADSAAGWFAKGKVQRGPGYGPTSAHEIRRRNGDVIFCVSPINAAYHAGGTGSEILAKKYPWATPGLNLNDVTYGIEHEVYPGAEDWPEEMIAASVARVKELAGLFKVTLGPQTVVYHRDIANTECPSSFKRQGSIIPPLSRWWT